MLNSSVLKVCSPPSFFLLCFIIITAFSCCSAEEPIAFHAHPMDEIPIADCHVHMVDFLQNGGYLHKGNEVAPEVSSALPSGSRHLRIELLLWKMEQCNISDALICGMPFIKKWNEDDPFRSAYYLSSSSRVVRARDTDYTIALAVEDFRNAKPEKFEKEFQRIYPFICGFDGTDVGAVGMIIKRIKEFPGVWKGIGEVMSRHDDLTNLTLGERPRANHSSLFRIYDFAGQHGLPVSLHHNIAPIAHDGKDHGTRYLREIIDAFETFPKTQFIWCHAGISRRIVVDDLVEIHTEILSRHSNHVCLDLSWVVFEDYILERDEQRNLVLDSDGDPKVRKEWIELIERYPNNFMLGSDVVADFRKYHGSIRKYNALLKVLNPETRKLIANGNFRRVMPTKGLTIPMEYQYPESRFTRYEGPLENAPDKSGNSLDELKSNLE